MSNVLGTWRCVCEQDTAHIHVMVVANRILEPAIRNLHLLLRAAQAAQESSNQSEVKVWRSWSDEQCAWYVEVCVCVCVSRIRHIFT